MSDEKKQPGITFLAVFVTKVNFDCFPNREPGTLITKLNVINNFVKDTPRLESNLSVEISTSGDFEKTSVKLEVNILGIFEEQKDSAISLKSFSEIQAPALLFPYLREAITSITARSPMGPLILPPTNVLALIKEGQASIKV
jgi:preprotein translocase subunit SecB